MLTKNEYGQWVNNKGEICEVSGGILAPAPEIKHRKHCEKISHERWEQIKTYYAEGMSPAKISGIMGVTSKAVCDGLLLRGMRQRIDRGCYVRRGIKNGKLLYTKTNI
ncbi:MAG: hypothetical protein WC623_24385 [Pedobacter sp.]|uniref:hypothetical protein n=1 Tax=Pedobacter sp. TaxID=1411316 RepID=UPI00356A5FB6